MDILERVMTNKGDTYDLKCLPLLLLSAAEVDARFNRTCGKFGISYLQNLILRYLANQPDKKATINELSDTLSQKVNISRSAKQLALREFVIKERSKEDERVVFVHITQKGIDLNKELDKKLAELYVLNLEEDEAEQLYKTLTKIINVQREYADEDSKAKK